MRKHTFIWSCQAFFQSSSSCHPAVPTRHSCVELMNIKCVLGRLPTAWHLSIRWLSVALSNEWLFSIMHVLQFWRVAIWRDTNAEVWVAQPSLSGVICFRCLFKNKSAVIYPMLGKFGWCVCVYSANCGAALPLIALLSFYQYFMCLAWLVLFLVLAISCRWRT